MREPASSSSADFATFINEFAVDGDTIPIDPGQEQTSTWQVNYGRNAIPVGATALGYEFGGEYKEWVMGRMTGCTAIIAVVSLRLRYRGSCPLIGNQSSKGMYAGHLWQASKGVGGAGAFTEKTQTRKGDIEWRQRSKGAFQLVGVDIWGQITSDADQGNRPNWRSIADIQRDDDSILSDGNDVQVWYMTLAKTWVSSSKC